jgi:hypothetical protein
MSVSPVVSLVISVPVVGLIIAISLSYAYQAGRKGKAGLDMLGAVITMIIAGGFFFFLGQQFPHMPIMDWWFSLSRPAGY